MTQNHISIKKTEDDSDTLFQSEINECYHSTHGAIQESLHIFIKCGLNEIQKEEINILEVGFGTGLNAFCTLLNKGNKTVFYHSLEKYPVDPSTIKQLNYAEKLAPNKAPLFQQLHQVEWNNPQAIEPHFTLEKTHTDATTFPFKKDSYDLIYFDAFSPEKQGEMWTIELFEKLFVACQTGAILMTYCAKGSVRRNLQAVGFTVERIPGPPGKREILRARKG